MIVLVLFSSLGRRKGCHKGVLFHDLELSQAILGKSVLMLVPHIDQFVNIGFVYFVEISFVDLAVTACAALLFDSDRLSYDDVHSSTIRHQAHVVVEDASCMEERDGKPHSFFDDHLKLVDEGVLLTVDLLVEFIFSES